MHVLAGLVALFCSKHMPYYRLLTAYLLPLLALSDAAKEWDWAFNASTYEYSWGFLAATWMAFSVVFFSHFMLSEQEQCLFFKAGDTMWHDILTDVDWSAELASTKAREAAAGKWLCQLILHFLSVRGYNN